MFIRRTKTRTTASGEHYYSYRIVDTYRVGEHVRQRTLLNLGSGFHVPHEQWSAYSSLRWIVSGYHPGYFARVSVKPCHRRILLKNTG